MVVAHERSIALQVSGDCVQGEALGFGAFGVLGQGLAGRDDLVSVAG